LYEVGRRATFPKAIDGNGVVVAVARDAAVFRDDAAVLSGALSAGEFGYWLGSDYPFHIKLYAVCFALFGPWLGYNVLSAEPANALLYLVSIALGFRLGREVFDCRAGLIAAGAVALWPSYLLHSTQLLKDPFFVPGFLALVLILVRWLTRTYSWAGALRVCAAGAGVVTALWLTRTNWRWLLIATVLIGALMLVGRQLREGRVLAANLAGAALLLGVAVSAPPVITKALKPAHLRDRTEAAGGRELGRPPAGVEAGRATGGGSAPQHIWSRAAAHVGAVRRELAEAFPESGSDIDPDVRIDGASDLLGYLPRAAAVGFFAPFPNMWLTSGKRVGSAGRRLAGLESLAMYTVEVLALVGLWRGRRRLTVWLLASVAAVGMTALGLVFVNVGALYRLRYVFVALLIVVAAGAVADTLGRRSQGSSGSKVRGRVA
jgi:hypothetical protein